MLVGTITDSGRLAYPSRRDHSCGTAVDFHHFPLTLAGTEPAIRPKLSAVTLINLFCPFGTHPTRTFISRKETEKICTTDASLL